MGNITLSLFGMNSLPDGAWSQVFFLNVLGVSLDSLLSGYSRRIVLKRYSFDLVFIIG